MNMEIERKWLLYRLPVLPLELPGLTQMDIIQVYTTSGRYRKQTYPSTGETRYFHTIKSSVSPGINNEDERSITPEYYAQVLGKSTILGYVKKHRTTWEDGDVEWFMDSLSDTSTLLLEAEIPDIDHPITIPDFLADCIYAEVTEDARFTNYALRSNLM